MSRNDSRSRRAGGRLDQREHLAAEQVGPPALFHDGGGAPEEQVSPHLLGAERERRIVCRPE